MSEQPGRHSDQFNLRLPDGMRERLKSSAEANKRSMNAEIVARIESSYAVDEFAASEPERHLQQQFAAARVQYQVASAEYEATKDALARFEDRLVTSEATMRAILELLEQARTEREAASTKGRHHKHTGQRRIDLDDREPGQGE